MKNLIPLIVGLAILGTAPVSAQTRTVFNINSPPGGQTPFDVRVHNECKRTHVFDAIKSPRMGWLKIESSPHLTVRPGESSPLKVLFDTAGLPGDSYYDELIVKCTDCASEPRCTQDHSVFAFQLEVMWTRAELQAVRPDTYLQNEILVALPLAQPAQIDAIVQQLAATYQLTRNESFEVPSISAVCVRFGIQGARSVAEVILAVSSDPRVQFAEPNFVYRSFSTASGSEHRHQYNDPLASLQYGPPKIRADAVHRYSTGKG